MYSITETTFLFWDNFVKTFLILILIFSMFKIVLKKSYNLIDFRLITFGMIISSIQFIFNILINLIEDYQKINFLKNIFFEVLTIFFIGFGWSTHNNQSNSKKEFFRIFIFYFTGVLLMLIK